MLSKQSLLTPVSGPADILFADKAAIQKILVDDDFRKSHDYERIREDPHVASLITETDKVKYKQKVITILLVSCKLTVLKLTLNQRRQLSPAFSISYLNGLEALMHECIQVFTRVLDTKCNEAHGAVVIDMNRILAHLTSVSSSRIAEVLTKNIGCHERSFIWWIIQPGRV